MGGNASFAHIAQMIVPCVSSAFRDCAKKRIIALVYSFLETSIDMDHQAFSTAPWLRRSISRSFWK